MPSGDPTFRSADRTAWIGRFHDNETLCMSCHPRDCGDDGCVAFSPNDVVECHVAAARAVGVVGHAVDDHRYGGGVGHGAQAGEVRGLFTLGGAGASRCAARAKVRANVRAQVRGKLWSKGQTKTPAACGFFRPRRRRFGVIVLGNRQTCVTAPSNPPHRHSRECGNPVTLLGVARCCSVLLGVAQSRFGELSDVDRKQSKVTGFPRSRE